MNKKLINLSEFINLYELSKKIWDDQEIIDSVRKYIIAFDPAAEGEDYSEINEISIINPRMYCQVEENSQFFTNLNQILHYLNIVSEDDYLKTGIYNTIQRGYNIQHDVLYKLVYNPCYYESVSVTLSIHKTKKSAEEAMQIHKDAVKADFDDVYNNPEYPVDFIVDDMKWDDNQFWSIEEIKIEK